MCHPQSESIGRVNAAKLQMVFHAFTERRIGFREDLRHEQQGRPCVKAMPITYKLAAPATGSPVLFQHFHGETSPGQASSRGNASEARADYQGSRMCIHFLLLSQTLHTALSCSSACHHN